MIGTRALRVPITLRRSIMKKLLLFVCMSAIGIAVYESQALMPFTSRMVDHQLYVENQSAENIAVKIYAANAAQRAITQVVRKKNKDWIHLGKSCAHHVVFTITSGQLKGSNASWNLPPEACTANLTLDVIGGKPVVTNHSIRDKLPVEKNKLAPALLRRK